MKLLGAILAGGQSRRFGSDKAGARLDGKRMIDHVAERLAPQVDGVVVCGREEPGFECLADLPVPGLGPLGGLNAALHHAARIGCDYVVSAGCDVPDLPLDLVNCLVGDGPAIVDRQPVIGFWPVILARHLDEYLRSGGRALYGFADASGARQVAFDPPMSNVNTPGDLPSRPK